MDEPGTPHEGISDEKKITPKRRRRNRPGAVTEEKGEVILPGRPTVPSDATPA